MKTLLSCLLLLTGCGANAAGPSPVEAPPVTLAPPATIPISMTFMAPPEPPPVTDCDPDNFHFAGWRFDVSGLIVHATPTWGPRGGANSPIPDECRAFWVGPNGPQWFGVAGAVSPADHYTFIATEHGTLWACTTTSGECVNVTI